MRWRIERWSGRKRKEREREIAWRTDSLIGEGLKR